MGLSAFNAMRAKEKARLEEEKKKSHPFVSEVDVPEDSAITTDVDNFVEDSVKMTDAEKIKRGRKPKDESI